MVSGRADPGGHQFGDERVDPGPGGVLGTVRATGTWGGNGCHDTSFPRGPVLRERVCEGHYLPDRLETPTPTTLFLLIPTYLAYRTSSQRRRLDRRRADSSLAIARREGWAARYRPPRAARVLSLLRDPSRNAAAPVRAPHPHPAPARRRPALSAQCSDEARSQEYTSKDAAEQCVGVQQAHLGGWLFAATMAWVWGRVSHPGGVKRTPGRGPTLPDIDPILSAGPVATPEPRVPTESLWHSGACCDRASRHACPC